MCSLLGEELCPRASHDTVYLSSTPRQSWCTDVNCDKLSSLLTQGRCLRQAKQQAASWAPGASHSYTKTRAIPGARVNPNCCGVHTTEQTQEVPWDSEESSWLCLGQCRSWTLPICIQFWYHDTSRDKAKCSFERGDPAFRGGVLQAELGGCPIYILMGLQGVSHLGVNRRDVFSAQHLYPGHLFSYLNSN